MSDTAQFFNAVRRGDAATVKNMVKADPSLASAFDSDGATALHYATFNAHREVVEILLQAGADMNARDRIHGATPAGWAIEYLRERGALLAVEIEDLRFAVERGDAEWIERFVSRHPALANAVDRDGKLILEVHK